MISIGLAVVAVLSGGLLVGGALVIGVFVGYKLAPQDFYIDQGTVSTKPKKQPRRDHRDPFLTGVPVTPKQQLRDQRLSLDEGDGVSFPGGE